MGRALITVRDSTGQIVTAVDLAIEKCSDFTQLWRDFRGPWYATRRQMVRTLGRSTGTPWPSYDQTPERRQYKWIKAKITGADPDKLKPLHWENAKGRLLPSLTEYRHPFGLWRPRKTSLFIGTRVPYAKNHNEGVGYSPRWPGLQRYSIPKRPLFGFGRDARSALADAVGQHAARVAAEVGRTRVGYTSDKVARMTMGPMGSP